MWSDKKYGRCWKSSKDLARITAKVVSPKTIRRPNRKWWRNCEAKVSRREAVETVNDTVVGDGRKVVRWGRVVSIGIDSTNYILAPL